MAKQDKPQVTASSSSNTPPGELQHSIGTGFGRRVPFNTRTLSDGSVVLVDEEEQPSNQGRDETTGHLVILVHGINTRALWMGEIKPALEAAGLAVAPTSFGKFSILRFLMPFSWSREAAIRRVAMDIQTARRVYSRERCADPERMSVISHSFGTYVVSRILTDYSEFKWHRVIFCGSVVREDFRFDHVLDRFDPPLLNEVGTKDFLPALAESAGWGYGSVGSTGFNRPPVETRWHDGYSHSDFLTEKFCNEFWIPFLRGEKPRRGDKAAHLPLWITSITWLPLRWLPWAILLPAMVAAAQIHVLIRNTQIFSPPPSQTFTVCRGEKEQECQVIHDTFIGCKEIEDWATDTCKRHTDILVNTHDGNRCGYTTVKINCVLK
jgi:pimeloyl-ACP methyl ester carboxylesterase